MNTRYTVTRNGIYWDVRRPVTVLPEMIKVVTGAPDTLPL